MSVPNKSLDKNKRYAGVKTNDFVNKTRANEANRSAVRPQGWANLGKINSRRIPPPANLPSLKSETGVNPPAFDPTITTNHGWTSSENQIPMNSISNPTQQQLDSLPMNSPTPPPSADIDKPRIPPTWSTVTAGSNSISMEKTPNLLALNDFPRLATTQDRKSQPESTANIPNPTFRPANLAIWKEGGGGTRTQPLSNDLSQIIPHNPGANFYQQQIPNPHIRMYPPQMWTYNPYTPMHQQQQMNTLNDYKSPTILRNKDIDDLSKLTDNTWANASQEVNYEEKIHFSDDDDEHHHHHHHPIEILDSNNKSRRMKSQVLQHSRLIQDDKHLKQMQDDKNSELINALTIAKQRRDQQERHLRNEQLISNIDEQKQIPGYQTRPLLSANEQENYNSSSSWQTNRDLPNTSRTRHDTANSQSSFTMRSWSDQMDSFNYSSLHEKSGGHMDNDESSGLNKYSRSQSESSSQSPHENDLISRKTKKFPLSSKKQQKPSLMQTKISLKKPNKPSSTDYYDNQNNQLMNSNDQWDKSIDNRRRQQLHSDDHTIQKSNRYNKQSSTKTRDNDRQQLNSRSKATTSSSNKTNQSMNNKNQQPAWRPLSPTRPLESSEPTPQESISYKSQQRTNLNDHKQRYQTPNSLMMNTASIPPLMSVRSDATTTAKLYNTANHTSSSHYDEDYYDDDNAYYNSNLQTHQRYHNRGYTTLGSYGRYRRSGTLRHQQQYSTYNINNTSGISSAPSTSTGTRQKKNATNRMNTNNKKPNQSSEQTKTPVVDESNSTAIKKQTTLDEVPIAKPTEISISSPTTEIAKSNDISEQKTSVKIENQPNPIVQTENESTKVNKKNTTPTTTATSNAKRRTNKDQQHYHHDQRYQNQQPPRHRNNFAQSMQEYEAMQMAASHNYYGANHRTSHSGRNTHMHDLSSGYYYEHPRQHYNNRYNYSNEHYQQQQQQQQHTQQQRLTNKNSKRVNSSTKINRQQITNGSNNNNNNINFRHHSISDTDQKEGEEWETASESSTNMRNGHYDNTGMNNQQLNETKSINRGRTPPKKSFSNQRPNARQIFKYTNA